MSIKYTLEDLWELESYVYGNYYQWLPREIHEDVSSLLPCLIERHLDKAWHWGHGGLSRNTAITPEFIERHLDKAWHWGEDGLSNNPVIFRVH